MRQIPLSCVLSWGKIPVFCKYVIVGQITLSCEYVVVMQIPLSCEYVVVRQMPLCCEHGVVRQSLRRLSTRYRCETNTFILRVSCCEENISIFCMLL